MLWNSKHSLSTAIGIIVMWCFQFSGINLINQYASFFKLTENEQFLLSFLLSIISLVWWAVCLYLVTIFGRKGLLMFGLLSVCCWNTLLFQVFDDDRLESDIDNRYSIFINVMVILIMIIYTMGFYFGIASVSWIYVTETMTPKGLAIAILFRLLVNIVVTTLPFLALNLSHYDSEASFIKYLGGFFFMYAGWWLINYFLLLVFLKETKELNEHKLRSLYRSGTFSITRSVNKALI